MLAAISSTSPDPTIFETYTAPSEVGASINDQEGLEQSTRVILADQRLMSLLHDEERRPLAILVACFSVHPLVAELSAMFPAIMTTGIFESSVMAAMSLQPVVCTKPAKWGIITTGKFWETHLSQGVHSLLGYTGGSSDRFAGTFSTGLTAGDFHTKPADEVERILVAHVRDMLLAEPLFCIVMGCGGMAGLEDTIRATAIQVYGQEKGQQLYIVDGVKAGHLQLQHSLRNRALFR